MGKTMATTKGLGWGVAAVTVAALSGSAAASGGGGGGGGGVPAGGGSVLPTAPPAPDVLMRESFGFADLARPAGGKGLLREVFIHETIGGFWMEWPGTKTNAWLAPDGNQTWKFAACSEDANELPSPLQATWGNGCVASEWFDAVPANPTALVPLKAPTTAYEVALDGWPAALPDRYVAIGLTASPALTSNLETSASVWLLMRSTNAFDGTGITYELRLNGRTGPLLSTGSTYAIGWNQLVLRYDPVAKTVSGSVNGIPLGTFAAALPTPRYVGFEGVGIADNFVVRSAP
ncbi:MAG: hypothetical protein U1F43_05915 [Myxococcota bacterium]